MRTKINSTSITLTKDQRSQLLKPFRLIARQNNYSALILSLQHPRSSGIWNYSFVSSLSNPNILEYGTTQFKLDGTEQECQKHNDRVLPQGTKRRSTKNKISQQEPSPNKVLKKVELRKFSSAEIWAKINRT